MTTTPTSTQAVVPILLFDDKCHVCRRISTWVRNSARQKAGVETVIVRPVGDDPEALRQLNAALDIWAAYARVHLLMPDGSMKLGGEAIAEVLRRLPNAHWFAWIFAVRLFGYQPFQTLLNVAYIILEDIRPLLGCESCGTPSFWVRCVRWTINLPSALFGAREQPSAARHFTSRPPAPTKL